jgi:hypothetical protein
LFCAHPIDSALTMADTRASQRFWGAQHAAKKPDNIRTPNALLGCIAQ